MDDKNKPKKKIINFKDIDLDRMAIFVLVAAILATSVALGYGEIKKAINKKAEPLDKNPKRFEVTLVDSIYLKNLEGYESEYYFKDNFLYDADDKKVNLIAFTKPIYIIRHKIDAQTLINMNLLLSDVKRLTFDYSTITDDCIEYFPRGVRNLSLNYCDFITDLSALPYFCPEINSLYINGLSSLTSIDFIYNLKELKYIEISDSSLITRDLLEYFKEKQIKINISEKDVENAEKIDLILKGIITNDMSDGDKIKAICLYLAENYDYDLSLQYDSNYNPLNCMIDNERGVCTGYSYLGNILLNKSGIKSFVIKNEEHCWNLIKYEGEYYYLDITNLKQNKINMARLKSDGTGTKYMGDPVSNNLYSVTGPLDEETIIPLSLAKDVVANNGIKREETTSFEDIALGAAPFMIFGAGGVLLYIGGEKLARSLKTSKKRNKN